MEFSDTNKILNKMNYLRLNPNKIDTKGFLTDSGRICHVNSFFIPTTTFYVVALSIPTTTFCVVVVGLPINQGTPTHFPMTLQMLCMFTGTGHFRSSHTILF